MVHFPDRKSYFYDTGRQNDHSNHTVLNKYYAMDWKWQLIFMTKSTKNDFRNQVLSTSKSFLAQTFQLLYGQ